MVHRQKLSISQWKKFNLNTSYVMVHLFAKQEVWEQFRFKYILCYGSSPLLKQVFDGLTEFKYILCYGSSELIQLSAGLCSNI